MEESAKNVTVVIPVFNGEDYLTEAIESVLNQTYRNFEILVVDDGSSDGTWAIVERYMDSYPDLVRGIRKKNGGTASALNAGILGSNAKYFAWLSHDDRFMPNKLELQFAVLESNPDAVGVYGDYSYINSTGSCIGRVHTGFYPQGEMLRHLLQTVFLNGSTLLIKRRCLIDEGLFDESLRYAQDALMWVHLVVKYQFAHIPEVLTEYRVHAGQTTSTSGSAALRRDNNIWLRRAVEDFTIEQVFPELKRPEATAADVAKAYLYFGRVMTLIHFQLQLGSEQYWKSWCANPSWRNPALVEWLKAMKFVVTQYFSRSGLVRRFSNQQIYSNPQGFTTLNLCAEAEEIKGSNIMAKD